MSVSSEVTTEQDARRPRRPAWASGTEAVQRVLAFGALIILFAVFSTLSEYFLNFDNVVDILLATAVNGVLALGVTFVITTGGIDLSVGTVMTLSAVLCAETIAKWHGPIALGIVVGIATGAACGLVNGLVIAKLKLPPFIATLGMFYAARGLALVISHSAPVYLTDEPAFLSLVMGKAVPGVPNVVLFFFAVAAVAAVVLGRTVLGRYTVALGSNEEATRLSGVPTDRWKIAVYTLGGTFTGLAGVLIAGRIGSAQPSLGAGYELDAIAAAVIGGTSLSGGQGTILGTVIGACVMSTLTNGLRLLSVPQEWQMVITGVILVLAVFLDVLRRRRTSS
jgi:ribose transport system permease protein